MTFKGTARIGSVNVKKEELLLDSLDEGGRKSLRTLFVLRIAAEETEAASDTKDASPTR